MKKAITWFAILILIASLMACKEKGDVCEPYSIREDPYNPGAYRVCNGDGTDETKYQGPTPAPELTKT